MIRMTVGDLVAATGATLVCGAADATFEGVTIDSRTVEPGMLFCALLGERTDGNRYVGAAIGSGASVVVVTAEPQQTDLDRAAETGAAILRAGGDDGEEFLLRLARAWRERNPQWLVVGITGSVGKTTTKEMLAAGLGASRRTYATKGNLNSLFGVPLTLFAADPADEVLVVEMGMNNKGEIARIAHAAMPAVAVITNVGVSHIGMLGSRENIARAKAEVVGAIRAAHGVGPVLVLTDGDDYTGFIERDFAAPAGVACVHAGRAGERVWAQDVTLDAEGRATLTLHVGDTVLEGTLSIPGRAMVADLVSAMAAIDACGLDVRAAFEAICAMEGAHMRLEVRGGDGRVRVIDDSYNASPVSMAASLDVLESMACTGRRIAVLGEMGELGDEAGRLHAMVAAYAAAKGLDLIVFVGTELADAMREAAITMGYSEDRVERFADAHAAASVLGPILRADDLVLVKASRAAGLDAFVEEVLQ